MTGTTKGNQGEAKDGRSRGAQPGNQNAAKGRETHFHAPTSHSLKGAAKVAAMPGSLADLINAAVREYIHRHRPDVAERFSNAFPDD